MNKLIELKNLTKNFDDQQVLRGINLDIYENEFLTLLGPSGCGKTTTMNIITNIIPKDEGEISIGDGRPVKIGYLPESPVIYGYMTSREYLEYIAACCNYDGDVQSRVKEVLD